MLPIDRRTESGEADVVVPVTVEVLAAARWISADFVTPSGEAGQAAGTSTRVVPTAVGSGIGSPASRRPLR
jgi:hypothetical protein